MLLPWLGYSVDKTILLGALEKLVGLWRESWGKELWAASRS